MADIEVDLFLHRKGFSAKQLEMFDWYRTQRDCKATGQFYEHMLALVWGRRCGKSDGATALLAEIIVDVLCEDADKVANGELEPWRGIGKPLVQQRKSAPHDVIFVIAPEGRDLINISGHLLDVFSGPAEVFLHPNPKMQLIDNGARMIFLHENACVEVWFIPAKHAAAMVGRGPAAVLITEAGFMPSTHWDRLVPAFMDKSAWVIAEGTPQQNAAHWFTQLAVSGLPDGHVEADRSIANRDPRVRTSRANTIDHAYLTTAREKAVEEVGYRGARWAELWVYASWKLPSDAVFDEYQPDRSVVTFELSPIPTVIFADGTQKILPRPSHIEMDIDWHYGKAPGASVVTAVWAKENPLNAADPRPLFVAIGEHMDDETDGVRGKRLPYSSTGWWAVLRTLQERLGVQRTYADPTGVDLIRAAKRAALAVRPANNRDKDGRIQLLNAQMHTPENQRPALLISRDCPKTAHCIMSLQWQRDRSGNRTNTPSSYNDHLSDCLCYTAGRHARPVRPRLNVAW